MLYGSIIQRKQLDHQVAKQTYSKIAACNKLGLLIGSAFAKLFQTDKEREKGNLETLIFVWLLCGVSMVLAVLHYIDRYANCKEKRYMYLQKHNIFIPSLTKVSSTGINHNHECTW